MNLKPGKHWFRDLVTVLCCYEVAAIKTGRLPTLTALQRKYRALGPVILVGLAVHFYQEDIKDLHARHRTAL